MHRNKIEAAVKIQRTHRTNVDRRANEAVVQLQVDQANFKTNICKIQRWYRQTVKLIKSRRSKVNPAVEQVLRDP